MAYNKTKLLEAAQKFLQLGKTAQAIGEFQLILKHEPKDQVTLMTVGDLYVRQGETFQAIEYFERLAQLFLADGFVSKAIAIYKKIAKLAPEETRPVERLADLYVQQGVLSEARPIYLRLAELHQRAGRHPQSAALLRKLLDAEPDNIRVQSKLAELSTAMGQPAEAAAAYRNAAEQLLRRGDHAEAVKFVDRALEANAGDVSVTVLKARILAVSGQRAEAITLLKMLPDIEAGGEASDYLLGLYLEKAENGPAAELAQRLYAQNARHYSSVQRVAGALLGAGAAEKALPLLNLVRETMTDAGEHEALSQMLQTAVEKLPKRLEPREWLVTLYERASDSFRLPDALSELAAAYEGEGKYDRARKVYEQLLDRNPEDESVRQRFEKIQSRVSNGADSGGDLTEAAAAAAEAVTVTETQPAEQSQEAPEAPQLDEEMRQFVAQSLTDVDLFSSYGLTQKAIDLLEVVLQRAPHHPAATERLLDLYLGAGNERRTAELASELEHIHTERNDSAAAERFAELHRRFGRTSPGMTAEPPKAPAPPPAPQFAVPEPAAHETSEIEPFPDVHELGIAPEPAGDQANVHEVDLSEEWAAMTADLHGLSAGQTEAVLEEIIEEFPEVASAPGEVLLSDVPPPAPPTSLADAIQALLSPPAAREPIASTEEFSEPPKLVETPAEFTRLIELMEERAEEQAAPAEELPAPLVEVRASATPAPTAVPELFAPPELFFDPPAPAMPEVAAPVSAAPVEPVAPAAPATPVVHEIPSAAAPELEPLSADDFLRSLTSEIEAATLPLRALEGLSGRASHTNGAETAPLAAPQKSTTPDGALHDVFDEFRAELDELSSDDEDPETHYNLGIAYREMGLLEESISELQKVAKVSAHGAAFRYAMQCCTLLGLAFMEKGEPGIAAMWYERALTTPGLDQESTLALRYDLGVAQELAGETSAARKSFSQVYGVNIDYRDVAERLAALGKG